MIISRTPFRVSFFGGGTDYPAWYRRHGGAVLGTTINKYCYITCRYLPPFFEHRIRVVWSKIENCQSIDEITHPAVREVLRHLGIVRGVEIHHDGDLPARSGIGSSSAFTVGLLHALYALKGNIQTKRQLALEGIYIERERLHETVGSQDQFLTAFGGFNHVTFGADGDISVRPMTLPAERIRELEAHLMLFYSGIARTGSNVAESYMRDLDGKESQIRLIGGMVDEAISVLAGGDDVVRFGRLLHEAWMAKRSLSVNVASPQIEDIYGAARSAGAIGGKLIGAGGGGFMLLFVPERDQKEVKERLRKLVHVPFRFDTSGTQTIFFDPEEDYSAEEDVRDGRLRETLQRGQFSRAKE